MVSIVSIGSATEDVFVYIPKKNFTHDSCVFHPGTKVDIGEMKQFTGGGATNTSVAFSRLGLKASIICALGKDEAADLVLKKLKSEKVDVKNVVKVPKENTSYSVILTGFGRDRVVLCYSNSAKLISKINAKWGKVKADWVYISSLHGAKKVLADAAAFVKKKKTKVAFNPGQAELKIGVNGIKRLFGKIDVLLLNTREAMVLTGSVDVRRNLLKLRELAEIVVITDGKNGAYATDGKFEYFVKPFDVKVDDVTGAGDSFGSGFTAAIAKGKGVEEALLWGTANASSVVMHVGTKNILLDEKGVKKFIAKYKTKENSVKKRSL